MCLGSVEGEKLRSSLLSGLAQMNWEEDIISDLLFGLFFVARRRKTHAELKVSCNKNLCVQCLLEMCSSFPLSSTPALGGGGTSFTPGIQAGVHLEFPWGSGIGMLSPEGGSISFGRVSGHFLDMHLCQE